MATFIIPRPPFAPPFRPLGASRKQRNRKTYGRNSGDEQDEDDANEVDEVPELTEADMDRMLNDFQRKLEAAKVKLETDLLKLVSTRATPGLVELIKVEVDPGSKAVRPLKQVALVVTEDASTLKVVPVDLAHLNPIFCSLTMELTNYKVQLLERHILITVPTQGEAQKKRALEATRNLQASTRATIRKLREDLINKLRKHKKALSEDMLFRQEKRVDEKFKKYSTLMEKTCDDKIKALG